MCSEARFTGYTLDGGYAEFTVADERFCVPIPEPYSDAGGRAAALRGLDRIPLARSRGRRKTPGHLRIRRGGAHRRTGGPAIKGRSVYAFTRPGDDEAQRFAKGLGAAWAGASNELPPEELDAAIIFAPVGALVPAALAAVRKGGTVVCGGIHMSDIPSFPYDLLWGERSVCSVANLTRKDAAEFMEIAPKVPVRTTTQPFALEQANEALNLLRERKAARRGGLDFAAEPGAAKYPPIARRISPAARAAAGSSRWRRAILFCGRNWLVEDAGLMV